MVIVIVNKDGRISAIIKTIMIQRRELSRGSNIPEHYRDNKLRKCPLRFITVPSSTLITMGVSSEFMVLK